MPEKKTINHNVGKNCLRFFGIAALALFLVACAAQKPRQALPSAPVATEVPKATAATLTTRLPMVPVLDPPEFSVGDAPPLNLWERLRASFRLPSCDTVPRATAWAHWYAGKQEYLDRVMQRAEPVLYFIVDEVQQRDMPGELALLPVVESAFHPFALSHASAAGLWQFIPATGQRYGLKQTWWYDGRRDIYAATHAAMDYLEFLGGMFDGDWLLAVAAYNTGESRVRRLHNAKLRRGGSASFTDISPSLPRETRSYVPKLLGLACVVADPKRFGVTLKPIVNEPRFVVVETGEQIDLALAANLAEMDMERLYSLNPAFNRWATDPSGPHRLLLPVEKVDLFKRNLADIPPEARVRWARHTIRKGESLSSIASKNNIDVATLKRVNGLSSNLIRAGNELLVPRQADFDDPELIAQARELSRIQTAMGVSGPRSYKVKRGDTLWAISRRFDVSVGALAGANGMTTGDVLSIGETLTIPGTGSTRVAANASNSRPARYTVKRGDSLWEISQRYDLNVQDLIRWNGLGSGAVLRPGQTLSLFPK